MVDPGKCIPKGIFEIKGRTTYQAEIESKSNDILYFSNGIFETRQYRIEKEFFDRFFRFPEKYGYRLVLHYIPYSNAKIYKKVDTRK